MPDIFSSLNNVLENIKGLKTGRLITLTLVLYPLLFIWIFKTHIISSVDNIINNKEQLIEVQNLNGLIKRMGKIQMEYESTAVMLYIYQPKGHNKRYKERIYCASDIYIPEYYTEKILIIDDTKVLSEYIDKKYSKATSNTKHALSIELAGHNLNCAYYIPIYNSKELIAELILVYKDDFILDVNSIYNKTQLFMYDIMSPPITTRGVD